jgi:hypothetical protein
MTLIGILRRKNHRLNGMTLTNTYNNDWDIQERIQEELRLIRCILERLLRVQNEALFVDYQMEKFAECPDDILTRPKGHGISSDEV